MMFLHEHAATLCLWLLLMLTITHVRAGTLGDLFSNSNDFDQNIQIDNIGYGRENENEFGVNFNKIPFYNDLGSMEEKVYQNQFASNALPQHPALPQHIQNGDYVAPKYMIELYNKFESDRYSHPMANIVRSFSNIYQDPLHNDKLSGADSTAPTRRHIMKFNISSVTRDDDIHLAELRLYTLVEADRNSYYGTPEGNDREVALYEFIDDQFTENVVSAYEFLDKKEIYGSFSGWETFTITDAVKRWARNGVEVKTIDIRITTIYNNYEPTNVNIETQAHRENEPLLVVFSNDKKKLKSEKKELHEIIMHYEAELSNVEDNYEYEYYDYYESDEEPENNRIYKRDTSAVQEQFNKPRVHLDNVREGKRLTGIRNSTKSSLLLHKKQMLKKLHEQILEMETEDTESSNQTSRRRVKRSFGRRRRAKHICRRKRLHVNFQDIKWHNWIIAPKGYEAFECTGKCFFPVSDHLTPTKHAIIQTLLYTSNPKGTQRACCVPTRLDPISVLYVDEKGIVTYKYKYEGMVVAECGCR